ncbi:MAG: hypothetical protein LC122_14005 [Chitinophagales bacterium]|nr:hypothetical protein [Chitinophagales bacterium]
MKINRRTIFTNAKGKNISDYLKDEAIRSWLLAPSRAEITKPILSMFDDGLLYPSQALSRLELALSSENVFTPDIKNNISKCVEVHIVGPNSVMYDIGSFTDLHKAERWAGLQLTLNPECSAKFIDKRGVGEKKAFATASQAKSLFNSKVGKSNLLFTN